MNEWQPCFGFAGHVCRFLTAGVSQDLKPASKRVEHGVVSSIWEDPKCPMKKGFEDSYENIN